MYFLFITLRQVPLLIYSFTHSNAKLHDEQVHVVDAPGPGVAHCLHTVTPPRRLKTDLNGWCEVAHRVLHEVRECVRVLAPATAHTARNAGLVQGQDAESFRTTNTVEHGRNTAPYKRDGRQHSEWTDIKNIRKETHTHTYNKKGIPS